METVNRLSDRVKQLEKPNINVNSTSTQRQAPISTNNTSVKSQSSNHANPNTETNSRLSRIEPGGRIRANNANNINAPSLW